MFYLSTSMNFISTSFPHFDHQDTWIYAYPLLQENIIQIKWKKVTSTYLIVVDYNKLFFSGVSSNNYQL